MRSRFMTLLTVIGALTVLVLAGNTVALATTGKAILAGKINTSTQPTTLTRTTLGTALVVKTKSTANAPLAVNGKGRVTNLNADKLDSLDSTQLATNTTVYTDSDFTTSHNSQSYWHFNVGAGDYAISYSVGVQPDTSGATVLCGFIASPDAYAWESGQKENAYSGVWLSGTATKHFTAAQTVRFFCNSSAPNWELEDEMALQITVTKITKATLKPALTGFGPAPAALPKKQGQ